MLHLLMYLLSFGAIDIDQAVKSNQVDLDIRSRSESAHYQYPLSVSVRNISGKSLELNIPTGSIFSPPDSSYQGFMSVEPMLVQLAPGETKRVNMPGMCIHQNRSAPGADVAYRYEGRAKGQLLSTAEMLEKEGLKESSLGQYAVWAVSDAMPLEEILAFDEEKKEKVLKYLTGLLDVPMPTAPTPDDYRRNIHARPKVEIGGKYEFRLSRPRAIQIAMFDKNNILVRELYNNPNEAAGYKRIDFSFDASVYNDDRYYFRLLSDGEIKMETEMTNY